MTEFVSPAQRQLRTQAADRLYSQAQRGRWPAAIRGLLLGRPARLQDLTGVEGRVVGQRTLGVQPAPLAQIRGSEGRTCDFDAAFRPLREHGRERWMSVARACLADTPLPAVELIRAGDIYYVRDGHHRISVARALGQREIDALVTVWDLAPANPANAVPRGGRPVLGTARG
jgi:hypothetical protein